MGEQKTINCNTLLTVHTLTHTTILNTYLTDVRFIIDNELVDNEPDS